MRIANPRRWPWCLALTSCVLDTSPLLTAARDTQPTDAVESVSWQPASVVTPSSTSSQLTAAGDAGLTSSMLDSSIVMAQATKAAPTTTVPVQDTTLAPAAGAAHSQAPAADTDAGPTSPTEATTPTRDAGPTHSTTTQPQCPNGDGAYCGGHGIAGESRTLYACAGGRLTPAIECPFACERAQGGSDHCSEPPDAGFMQPPPGAPPPGFPPGFPPPGSPPGSPPPPGPPPS